ncbi:MAG: hypothetical protein EZS28_023251, partial [Streblomastix strix]
NGEIKAYHGIIFSYRTFEELLMLMKSRLCEHMDQKGKIKQDEHNRRSFTDSQKGIMIVKLTEQFDMCKSYTFSSFTAYTMGEFHAQIGRASLRVFSTVTTMTLLKSGATLENNVALKQIDKIAIVIMKLQLFTFKVSQYAQQLQQISQKRKYAFREAKNYFMRRHAVSSRSYQMSYFRCRCACYRPSFQLGCGYYSRARSMHQYTNLQSVNNRRSHSVR